MLSKPVARKARGPTGAKLTSEQAHRPDPVPGSWPWLTGQTTAEDIHLGREGETEVQWPVNSNVEQNDVGAGQARLARGLMQNRRSDVSTTGAGMGWLLRALLLDPLGGS